MGFSARLIRCAKRSSTFRRRLCSGEWVIEGREHSASSLISACASKLEEHGVVLVRDMFSAKQCESLRGKLLGQVDGVLQQARQLPLGVGSAKGFHEVVVRSPGRYDVPCNFEAFRSDEIEPIEAVANGALERCERVFCGVVCSDVGSAAQEWHVDSLHESVEHGPANVINALLAIDDVDEDMGPTEVVPGSHRETNHLIAGARAEKLGPRLAYQHASNRPEAVGCARTSSAMAMSKGSALLFDDRLLHRGLANVSANRRRMLAYFSYKRADFKPSTHFEAARSLHKFFLEGAPGYAQQLNDIRAAFPGLTSAQEGTIFCDGAGGSQIHASALAAVTKLLVQANANVGGRYTTSAAVDRCVFEARRAFCDFFNVHDLGEIVFGANATTLNAHIGAAILRGWRKPRGNIVVSALDHDSNAGLWARLAARHGVEVRVAPLSSGSIIEPNEVSKLIDDDTALVAIGLASNALGTINDVSSICRLARQAGSLSYVDSVHAAPHMRIDVEQLGCDFCVVSPYKFFGPHLGVLWGKRDLLQSLDVDMVGVSDDRLPCSDNNYMSRVETGTQQFENIAGAAAAVDYIADLGQRYGGLDCESASRSQAIEAGYTVIAHHEDHIKAAFLQGAKAIPGLRVLGIEDPRSLRSRTSTFAVQLRNMHPDNLVACLVDDYGIYCTAGTHYCTFWRHSFNCDGATRLSFLHYNTLDEVRRVLAALESCSMRR